MLHLKRLRLLCFEQLGTLLDFISKGNSAGKEGNFVENGVVVSSFLQPKSCQLLKLLMHTFWHFPKLFLMNLDQKANA